MRSADAPGAEPPATRCSTRCAPAAPPITATDVAGPLCRGNRVVGPNPLTGVDSRPMDSRVAASRRELPLPPVSPVARTDGPRDRAAPCQERRPLRGPSYVGPGLAPARRRLLRSTAPSAPAAGASWALSRLPRHRVEGVGSEPGSVVGAPRGYLTRRSPTGGPRSDRPSGSGPGSVEVRPPGTADLGRSLGPTAPPPGLPA